MEPTINVRKADRRTGKVYKSMYIRTLRFPCLNKYLIYFTRIIKVVPSNIQYLLTPPRGLAHLLMGDGFFQDDQGVKICSESFTKEEQELLITAFWYKSCFK
jgi:hypothetical protein